MNEHLLVVLTFLPLELVGFFTSDRSLLITLYVSYLGWWLPLVVFAWVLRPLHPLTVLLRFTPL